MQFVWFWKWPSSLVPNPYQRLDGRTSWSSQPKESKTINHKFTCKSKATSLSKKLDILRKESNVTNVTCPRKNQQKHPCSAVDCRILDRPRRSNVSNWKAPNFHSVFIARMTHFHSTVFSVFCHSLETENFQIKVLNGAWATPLDWMTLGRVLLRLNQRNCQRYPWRSTPDIPWLCPIAKLVQTWK